MNILLTGRTGLVGYELERALPKLGTVAPKDRAALDVSSADRIRSVVREARPDVIVNAAAYTAVDQAESEPDVAMATNGIAPGVLAEEAKRLGALLVHFSTDYVFDGSKREPYAETDPANPVNVYGRTKLEGEQRIVASGCRYLILRTSWIYAERGKNFLVTILKAANEGRPLQVVDDQFGAPTAAAEAVRLTCAAIDSSLRSGAAGLFHMCADGRCSWYDFAAQIVRHSGSEAPVLPVHSDHYVRPARRPANSQLDCSSFVATFGIHPAHWSAPLPGICARARANLM